VPMATVDISDWAAGGEGGVLADHSLGSWLGKAWPQALV
jgi:hypothetical protein